MILLKVRVFYAVFKVLFAQFLLDFSSKMIKNRTEIWKINSSTSPDFFKMTLPDILCKISSNQSKISPKNHVKIHQRSCSKSHNNHAQILTKIMLKISQKSCLKSHKNHARNLTKIMSEITPIIHRNSRQNPHQKACRFSLRRTPKILEQSHQNP